MERMALGFLGNHQSEPLHCLFDSHAPFYRGADECAHVRTLARESLCVCLISIEKSGRLDGCPRKGFHDSR